jgi:hypothetical protein
MIDHLFLQKLENSLNQNKNHTSSFKSRKQCILNARGTKKFQILFFV